MIKVQEQGFSLVELSIVLLVIGMLSSSVVIPLVSSMKQARVKQTTAQLSHIRQAMHGYLASAGRLPCPINIDRRAFEQHDIDQPCAVAHGALPAAPLGVMGEQSATGALLDPWGRPYHYSVSLTDHQEFGQVGVPDWLSMGEPAAVGASNLEAAMELCRVVSSKSCSARNLIANQIVWVIFSEGQMNEGLGLQSENRDRDNVFVHSAYSSNPNQPFDDQLIWASRSELVYWLLKANWLP